MSQEDPLFFSSKKITEATKKERLLQLMAALREGGAKAIGSTPMTYAKAFAFLKLISPETFQDVGHLFQRQQQVPNLLSDLKIT